MTPEEVAAAASCRGTVGLRRHSWSGPFARPLRRPCSLLDGAVQWPGADLQATGPAPPPGANAILAASPAGWAMTDPPLATPPAAQRTPPGRLPGSARG